MQIQLLSVNSINAIVRLEMESETHFIDFTSKSKSHTIIVFVLCVRVPVCVRVLLDNECNQCAICTRIFAS